MDHKIKKHFGQNFLTQPKIAQDLVDAGKITANDTAMEIGPGKGVLTEKILATGAKLIAVEKDRDLISLLNEKFKAEIEKKQLIIINSDIRDIEIEKLKINNYKLIANIPYYITGEIIRNFLETKNQPRTMVLMVQKEVAERIVARNGKESILSISVKAYGEPKLIKKVSAGSFFPKPKVDSAILKIENISRNNFKKYELSEKDFFNIVKKGFRSPRKQLRSNLKIESKKWEDICRKMKISEKIRAEDLKINDWFELYWNITI